MGVQGRHTNSLSENMSMADGGFDIKFDIPETLSECGEWTEFIWGYSPSTNWIRSWESLGWYRNVTNWVHCSHELPETRGRILLFPAGDVRLDL
jgi:hypothetical protein